MDFKERQHVTNAGSIFINVARVFLYFVFNGGIIRPGKQHGITDPYTVKLSSALISL